MRSLIRVLAWVLLGLVGLAVVVFGVNNRAAVPVSLNPLPFTVTALPLSLWMFGALVVGVLVGLAACWMAGRDARRRSARRRRRLRELERQLAEASRSREEAAVALPSPRDAA